MIPEVLLTGLVYGELFILWSLKSIDLKLTKPSSLTGNLEGKKQ